MARLDALPLPVLLHLTRFLAPAPPTPPSLDLFEGFRIRTLSAFEPVPPALFALSLTSRALRRALVPELFRSLVLGQQVYRAEALTTEYAHRLAELAQEGGEALACVRVLSIAGFTREGVENLVECVKLMTSLEKIDYYAPFPFPPMLVDVLSQLPHFHALEFNRFGLESLPHILPLASKVSHLELDGHLVAPFPPDIVSVAPITIASARRAKLADDEWNAPTVQEGRTALVQGLAPFLVAAKAHLSYLQLDGHDLCESRTVPATGARRFLPFSHGTMTVQDGDKWFQRVFDAAADLNGREYPLFPKLERLRVCYTELKCLALKRVLRNAADTLTHLELVGADRDALPAVPTPLTKLKYFYWLLDDDVNGVALASSITSHSPLRTLVLNGVRATDLGAIFGPACSIGATLRYLRVDCEMTSPLRLKDVKNIVEKCEGVEELQLGALWGGEAVDCLAALSPLKRLRKFTFDHPWEAPRDWPLPDPDGRTIRSERNGDFRVISCMGGKTIAEEMRDRILADMDAVKPVYAKRFASFVTRHPLIEQVNWNCTERTLWIWTFFRDADSGKIRFRQRAEIDYAKEGEPRGQEMKHSGVFMTVPHED
ncbi:uncharacterized protein JCM10292_003799 [Rhodotorula paludigena]|uniref:uncharacterized protein n=1 Tax=Rhodotorula paludigena TaxID=86838 RepID=UPI00317D5849